MCMWHVSTRVCGCAAPHSPLGPSSARMSLRCSLFVPSRVAPGLIGAAFNSLNRRLTVFRKRLFKGRPRLRLVEAVISINLVISLFFWVRAPLHCPVPTPRPSLSTTPCSSFSTPYPLSLSLSSLSTTPYPLSSLSTTPYPHPRPPSSPTPSIVPRRCLPRSDGRRAPPHPPTDLLHVGGGRPGAWPPSP